MAKGRQNVQDECDKLDAKIEHYRRSVTWETDAITRERVRNLIAI